MRQRMPAIAFLMFRSNDNIMEPECRTIANEMIPAVRVYLAKQMNARYGMTQQEIAGKLGIAQVAVSKYVNGKYSKSVAKAEKELGKDIPSGFVDRIVRSKSPDKVNRRIEEFCEKQVYA